MTFHKPPSTYVRQLTLKVGVLARSVHFYEHVLGFSIIERTDNHVHLGVSADGAVLLTLVQPEQTRPLQANKTGLYHVAYLLPSRAELAQIAIHLSKCGVRFGSSDHLVSEALYLADPDGNGIEIYCDRPSKAWRWNGEHVAMTVDPLNFADLLNSVPEGSEWSGMPIGTVIGHIHLHVADIKQSERFYCDGLHFQVVARYGEQASFLSTGSYHHHIGINTWQGVGAPQQLAESVGLAHYTLAYPDEQSRTRVLDDLRIMGALLVADKTGVRTEDPSGNVIELDIHREGR